jgi:hypothetical protein
VDEAIGVASGVEGEIRAQKARPEFRIFHDLGTDGRVLKTM